MKKIYSAILLALATLLPTGLHANWEKVLDINGWGVQKTSKGTLIACEYNFYDKGDIYYSDDEGTTWNKTNTKDFGWQGMIEAGDYLFMVGRSGARVARSDDDGRSWIILNYTDAIKDYVVPKEQNYVGAMAIGYHPTLKRLFIATFASKAGIVYTDDWGETWHQTDRESAMSYNPNSKEQEFDLNYNFVYFKDKLYLQGAYMHYCYDETNNKWNVVKDPNGNTFSSNFLAVGVEKDGVYYGGRGQEDDYSPENNHYPSFVEKTYDMEAWIPVGRPKDQVSCFIRSMTADDKNIYATCKSEDCYYSPDNGKTWLSVGPGFPKSFCPIICTTDNYVFINAYTVNNPTSQGVFRYKKSELNTSETSIPQLAAADDAKPSIKLNNNELRVDFPGNILVTITDLKGSQIKRGGATIYTGNINPGVYIITINWNGGSHSQKIKI